MWEICSDLERHMVKLYDIFMVYLKKKVNNKKVIRGCYLSVRICSNQNQFNNSTDGVGILYDIS